jgi:hypothetical protein
MRRQAQNGAALGLVAALAVGTLGGCAILIEMETTPEEVAAFQPVEFNVKLTNQLTCPVGRVVALVFPFVQPRDMLDRVEAENREELGDIVDAFCAGEEIDPFSASPGSCRLDGSDVVCDVAIGLPRIGLAGEGETVIPTGSGVDISCAENGNAISCRFPESLLASAASATGATTSAPLLPLCFAGERVGLCFAPRLNPGAMRMGSFEQVPTMPGEVRNWAVAFAVESAGVCSDDGAPCSDDGDCGGSCLDSICDGGEGDGLGCEQDSDCDGGTCTECRVEQMNGDLLSGLACTETTVTGAGTMAPAMSTPFLVLTLIGLLALGAAASRRHRRS